MSKRVTDPLKKHPTALKRRNVYGCLTLLVLVVCAGVLAVPGGM